VSGFKQKTGGLFANSDLEQIENGRINGLRQSLASRGKRIILGRNINRQKVVGIANSCF